MRITVLGCGASGGVPLITGEWGPCDKENPKNRRTRTSLALQTNAQTWFIDMSPDLRHQCERENITHVDGVLCTHAHFDHVAGLDELEPFAVKQQKPIPLYADAKSLSELKVRYPYAFEDLASGPSIYKHFLTTVEITGPFAIGDTRVVPFQQDHRYSKSLGFRFPSWAYSTDVWELDETAFQILQDLDLWIVDCLDIRPRDTHTHLEKTLSWVDRLRPKETLLIHMSHHLDYEALLGMLPSNVHPTYDGMVIEIDE